MTPYTRPAYKALLQRIEADLAAMPAVLRGPLSVMWSRVTSGMHGHLDWLDKQCSPLTCELERLYDWAALYHVDRLTAKAAGGGVLATGNAGAQLLADAVLRGPNGLDYTVQAAIVLGAGNTPVTIRCATKGAAGNLAAGQKLTLVDPALGVDNILTVDALGISGGADDEEVNAWRVRVYEEWRAISQRGARSGKPEDYRYWAKTAHQSVTGALVQEHVLGMGTVVVRPVCNGLANRLPTQAILDAVAADLQNGNAPATADWRVTFPSVYQVSLNIHLMPAADTAQNRAAIFDSVNALVLSKGGNDVPDVQIPWGEVDAAIAAVTLQYVLDETVPVAWQAHQVPVLQPINWT